MVGGPIWMFKKFLGIISFASLVILVIVSYSLYSQFFPLDGETFSPEVPVKYSDAVGAVVEEVPAALPELEVERRPTLVLPLKNDAESLVTTMLRNALSNDGKYVSVEKGAIDRVLAKLGLGKEVVSDPKDAIKYGKSADAKVVAFGSVRKLKTEDESVSVSIQLEFYDVDTGKQILGQTFQSETKPPPVEPTPASVSSSSPNNGWLYAGLACFAIFWPLLLMPMMRKTIRAENNALTAVVLTLTILVPLAIGWTGIFADDWGGWSVVLFLVGGAAVALWTVFVMSRVAETEAY